MKEKFSQFSVGELEAGVRKRQGLAEARRHAQARGRNRGRELDMRTCVACFLAIVVVTWAVIVVKVLVLDRDDEVPFLDQDIREPQTKFGVGLSGWDFIEKLYAIGIESPGKLAKLLEEEDPFKVAVDAPMAFQCPKSEADRFSLPDVRNHDMEEVFKRGEGFIYYQHLRKAGGTGFCEMASRNMKLGEVPDYHCMPDERGAMATPPWSSMDFLLETMRREGFRITANEWDAFPLEHLSYPDAVFGTTFRHPVDRWYSQYRFEHVEHRDGTKAGDEVMPFKKWYKRVGPYTMGDNYYVKTFCGQANPEDEELEKRKNHLGQPQYVRDLYWSYHKFNSWGSKVAWEDLKAAMEVLRKFHLILILDFVQDEAWALERALGWNQERKQVLPHEKQAVRKDKKSISAREALPSDVWEEILNANVFDLLLFHWAKRLYLERSACRSVDVESISNLPPKIPDTMESNA